MMPQYFVDDCLSFISMAWGLKTTWDSVTVVAVHELQSGQCSSVLILIFKDANHSAFSHLSPTPGQFKAFLSLL